MLLSTILLPFFLLLSASAKDAQSPLQHGIEEHHAPSKQPLRVAIIGAGAAGSSTAYHLSLFANASTFLNPEDIQISIFDTTSRPGGRTTTVNALDDPHHPVELGASIYVKINRILYNASRDFGLGANRAYHDRPQGSDWGLGVWDGDHFVFKQGSSDDDDDGNGGGEGWLDWKGWWDIAKLLWRYGLSPIRTQRATKDAVSRLLRFYDRPIFPFRELNDAVAEVELLDITGVTGAELLHSAGVGEKFQLEIIQASTRVNYGQNLAQIHGLEALVCMAIEDAMSVQGGNWQIFKHMVERSNAEFRPNTTVTDVQRDLEVSDKYRVRSISKNVDTSSTEETTEDFDTVILAAPYQFANITFFPPLAQTPAEVPYVRLHVTLFTSPHRLSPSFFSLNSPQDVPTTILTTLPEGSNLDSAARGLDAVGPAGFWSISTLRAIELEASDGGNASTQYLYKVFSPAPLSGTWMASLLGFPYTNTTTADTLADLQLQLKSHKTRHITWLHEKAWHSYPYEIPRRSFERTRLERAPDFAGKGVWYTSGMEGFISTMETSALMGRNVAGLLVQELGWGRSGNKEKPEEFNE